MSVLKDEILEANTKLTTTLPDALFSVWLDGLNEAITKMTAT
jgi:hypothetical protein